MFSSNFAKETIKRTNKRSIRAPPKPKKKNLIQSSGTPRKALSRLPTIITPNHTREEKKERAEERLQLKIGSFFMKMLLIIRSESKVRMKKLAPNPRPTTKFSRETLKSRIDRIPPCIDRTPRYRMILLWEGSPNSLEYLFTILSIYLSVESSIKLMPLYHILLGNH